MSKRAIILGGAGLIGSHLCVKLLGDGYDVICIDRRSRQESPLLRNIENRERFHYINHDITTPYEIGCDELYNLSAINESGERIDSIATHRLVSYGSINAMQNLIGSNTKVLYCSADDIYNFDRLDFKYTSDRQFVADAKRFGESIHRSFHLSHNIDVRIARVFSTYGTNSGIKDNNAINKMIMQTIGNHDITIYGNGEQIRTFCWVDDMVDGLVSLMRADSTGNIITADFGSAEQISIRKLAEMIIALTNSQSLIHHIAPRVDEVRYKLPNLNSAESQLNWRSKTSLDEGLKRTIRYIEKELSQVAMEQMSWVEVYG